MRCFPLLVLGAVSIVVRASDGQQAKPDERRSDAVLSIRAKGAPERLVVQLQNRSSHALTVDRQLSRGATIWGEIRGAQGRQVEIPKGTEVLTSCTPMILSQFGSLQPGESIERVHEWQRYLEYRVFGRGPYFFRVSYSTGRARHFAEAHGVSLWSGKLRSNWIAFRVQDGAVVETRPPSPRELALLERRTKQDDQPARRAL